MSKPLISIVLPVYNGEEYLHEAISSCINQTYGNIEVIVVDDCSTDSSYEIAKNFQNKDSRIKLILNSENKKLPASLNIGHEIAKGEYLTWTSHDNIYHPEAIENLHKVLVKQNTDVVYSSYLIIDEKGAIIGSHKLKEIEYSFFYGVVGACFLYSKKFYIKNGEYDENLFLLEDFDFWLRGLKHGNFYKIDNPGFYFYRYHGKALTSEVNKNVFLKKDFQQKRTKCYEKLFGKQEFKDSKSKLVEYFSKYFSEDLKSKMVPLQGKTFFNELKSKVLVFKGITFIKLKRIIVNDCIEIILKNKEYQKLSFLFNLHLLGGTELLRLSVKRYLVLWKKCLF